MSMSKTRRTILVCILTVIALFAYDTVWERAEARVEMPACSNADPCKPNVKNHRQHYNAGKLHYSKGVTNKIPNRVERIAKRKFRASKSAPQAASAMSAQMRGLTAKQWWNKGTKGGTCFADAGNPFAYRIGSLFGCASPFAFFNSDNKERAVRKTVSITLHCGGQVLIGAIARRFGGGAWALGLGGTWGAECYYDNLLTEAGL